MPKTKPYITRLEDEIAVLKAVNDNNKEFAKKIFRAVDVLNLQKEVVNQTTRANQWKTAAIIIFILELLLATKAIIL